MHRTYIILLVISLLLTSCIFGYTRRFTSGLQEGRFSLNETNTLGNAIRYDGYWTEASPKYSPANSFLITQDGSCSPALWWKDTTQIGRKDIKLSENLVITHNIFGTNGYGIGGYAVIKGDTLIIDSYDYYMMGYGLYKERYKILSPTHLRLFEIQSIDRDGEPQDNILHKEDIDFIFIQADTSLLSQVTPKLKHHNWIWKTKEDWRIFKNKK